MALASRLAPVQAALEPWYLTYGLAGLALGGVAPILLPLVIDQAGDASDVGLVIATIGLGGLSATCWGALADRFGGHRLVFAGGGLVGGLALASFDAVSGLAAWMALALLIGMGQAAANTVATLFIVERYPRAEWSPRVGWLQTVYNAGIVAGLVLAGSVSHLPLSLGLLAGGGAFALAGLLGWALTRPAGAAARARLPHHQIGLSLHGLDIDWAHASPLRLVHPPRLAAFQRTVAALRTPFGLFLVVWLVANVGVNAIYTLYPLLVREVYGVAPGPSSFALAAATAVGLALYSPTSALSARAWGPYVCFRAPSPCAC